MNWNIISHTFIPTYYIMPDGNTGRVLAIITWLCNNFQPFLFKTIIHSPVLENKESILEGKTDIADRWGIF